MSNNTKRGGGPKTNEGKVISSQNSITHGLTARRWLDTNEQSLFNETVEAFNSDFDPQTSIEKILISKLDECTVRLMRIQQVESAMFDLASSEAEHPNEIIKSLDNGNSDSNTIEAMQAASLGNPKSNPKAIIEKINLINEIDSQKQAGLNQIGELSGHSFRVGAALDLLDKNIPLEKIMLRGGWKSETSAMRYLQSWNDSNWLIIN